MLWNCSIKNNRSPLVPDHTTFMDNKEEKGLKLNKVYTIDLEILSQYTQWLNHWKLKETKFFNPNLSRQKFQHQQEAYIHFHRQQRNGKLNCPIRWTPGPITQINHPRNSPIWSTFNRNGYDIFILFILVNNMWGIENKTSEKLKHHWRAVDGRFTYFELLIVANSRGCS